VPKTATYAHAYAEANGFLTFARALYGLAGTKQ
jgi:hypothetical protein